MRGRFIQSLCLVLPRPTVRTLPASTFLQKNCPQKSCGLSRHRCHWFELVYRKRERERERGPNPRLTPIPRGAWFTVVSEHSGPVQHRCCYPIGPIATLVHSQSDRCPETAGQRWGSAGRSL